MKTQQKGLECCGVCLACSGCGCVMVEDRLSNELHRCEGKVRTWSDYGKKWPIS